MQFIIHESNEKQLVVWLVFVDIAIDYLCITIDEWVCGVILHSPVALRFLPYAFLILVCDCTQ